MYERGVKGNVEISFQKRVFAPSWPGEGLRFCVMRGPHEVLGAQRPHKRFHQTLGVADRAEPGGKVRPGIVIQLGAETEGMVLEGCA